MLAGPARERSEIWRTAVGVLALAVGSVILTAVWLSVVPALADTPFVDGTTPTGMLWILSSFLCPLATLALVMRLLHKRHLLSLGGLRWTAISQFTRVMAAQLAVLALALLLPSPGGQEPVANLSMNVWLTWLVPAICLLVVQVSVEELMFRGYLQSQLAARFSSPLIWLVMPAVLFAVLHLDPTAGDNRWPVVAVTLLFALAAGDLTARSGTLGPALAIHLVNNFGALMLVGAKGPMQGLSLYVLPVDMADPSLMPAFIAEALLILISWLAARIVLKL